MITESQTKNLRRGDVVYHIASGKEFIVIENGPFGVTAVCSVRVSFGLEWDHTFTPAGVPVLAPKGALSLVEVVTELEKLGWTFDGDKNEWTSPDGAVNLRNLKYAWKHRHDFKKPKVTPYPSYVPSFIPRYSVRRAKLRNAGWTSSYGTVWRSPGGIYYEGSTPAWTEMERQRMGGNPS